MRILIADDHAVVRRGLKQILAGVLEMESDWSTGCGAVFHATKR